MRLNITGFGFLTGALISATLAGGCSSKGPQVVTGRAELASFPEAPASVEVVQNGHVRVRAPIAADGAFSLTVPPGKGYRVQFVSAAGRPTLVSPHASGKVGATFIVNDGGKPFSLGAVRYLGQVGTQSFSFRRPGAAPEMDKECEDGIDPSGGVCVDDDDDENEECGENNDVEGPDEDDVKAGPGAVGDHNLPAAFGCADEDDGENNEIED